MAKLTKEQIREKLLNRKRRMKKLETSLPDLEELDGHLAVMELTAKDVEDAQNLSKGPDGEAQDSLMGAIMITKSLVTYDTKERIFSEQDAGFIVDNFGLLVLQPLGVKVQEISGLSGDALEEAKKNLKKIKGSGQATSSDEK
jgi:hypothetical protein